MEEFFAALAVLFGVVTIVACFVAALQALGWI